MLMKMKQDRRAALDGVNVSPLAAGETYDLPDALAQSYLERGLAAEAKAETAAPENKDAGAAPKNKARRSRKKE
jgi:hypothetical protein